MLLFFNSFSAFSQIDSAKYRFAKTVFQLAKEQTGNSSTIPLTLSRFLVFQSLATNTAIPQSSELTKALTRTRNQVTASGEVPIGIINATINNSITGEKQRIFIASPLQKEVFQAAVQFRISPLLLQSNSSVPIDSIALDFNDGLGWHTFPFTEQLVSHQFTTLGERTIGIKLITKEEVVTIQIPFDVKQLERPAIYDSQRVIANASTTAKAGRATENVNGAEYRIHLGCDGIFDKPVIIAEGFDANEDVNLDDLTAKYYSYLYDLRNNGYDLVLVNYDNGRTWIQDNAQVLKAIINQVNATKVGTNKLIVIGESMSGLIARYALKEMENAGQTHQVSHFVAFDSPMKGANVPYGMLELRRWVANTFESQPLVSIASILNDIFGWFPALRAHESPAAKQMLMTMNDPEYSTFQTTLTNLGYPSQNGIRNIALIDGALDGAFQHKFNRVGNFLTESSDFLQPGDKIFDYNNIWILINSDVDVWSNEINNNTRVFRGRYVGILGGISLFDGYANSAINYDRLAGGQIQSTFGNTVLSFAFVPTFSAIDYRGTLANDTDYTIDIRNFRNETTHQVTNTALTPFAAIYGNYRNSYHATPSDEREGIEAFGRDELGLDPNRASASCSPPPTPTMALTYDQIDNIHSNRRSFPAVLCKTKNYLMRLSMDPNNEDVGMFPGIIPLDVVDNLASEYGTYTLSLKIDGPSNYFRARSRTTNSQPLELLFDYRNANAPDGIYDISVNRDYYGTTNRTSSVHKQVIVQSSCPVKSTCSYSEGEFLFWDIASGTNIYAHQYGNLMYATNSPSAGGGFIRKSQLISSSIVNTCFEETDPRICENSSGTGLTAQYFGNSDLQTNPQPVFTQGEINMGGDAWAAIAGTSLLANNISARWQGYVEAPVTGSYTFNMRTDDGTRVWFDNVQKVNDWNDYPPTDHLFTVNLTAGQKYPVKIEWKQFGGGYEAKFSWSINGGARQIVPMCRLYSNVSCQSPTPVLTASPSSISSGQSSTLTASGCSGTVTWWDGSTGTTKVVSSSGSYTASCQNSGCSASTNGSVAVGSISTTACQNGNFNGFLDMADCNAVGGWVFDWNNLGRTVQVEIYVDGNKVAIVDANQNRTDLATAFNTSAAIPHGYTYYVPSNSILKNGQNHTVTVKPCGGTGELSNSGKVVSNCTGGTSCQSPAPTISANPTSIASGQSSTLTTSGCSGTITWSDGTTGNSKVVSSTGTYSASCENSGCSPSGLISVVVTGENSQSCPNGNFFASFDGATCDWIGGWVFDNNDLSRTVQVDIYVDGVKFTTIDANINRPDLGAYFGNSAASPHGFTYYVPSGSMLRNGQNHIVMVKPCGGTNELPGSPKTISGCTSGARLAVESLSLKEESQFNVTISPNPTTGKVTLDFVLEEANPLRINVYDSQGKNLLIYDLEGKSGRNSIPLDLSTFSTGLYLLNVQTGNKQSMKRVIKIE